MHRHQHLDRIVSVSFSDFICDLVRLSLMNRVRHPSCQILGCGGLARTSSDGTTSAISMSVTNPRAAEADRAAVVEEEPEGVSIPAVICPGSTAPRARGIRSLLLTELLREARQGFIAKALMKQSKN